MAAADVANPVAPALSEKIEPFQDKAKGKHNVRTVLNYYLEPEDGSPPQPSIVG